MEKVSNDEGKENQHDTHRTEYVYDQILDNGQLGWADKMTASGQFIEASNW